MENRAHALELVSETAVLLLVGIGRHDEVRAGDLDPILWLVAGGGEGSSQKQCDRKNP